MNMCSTLKTLFCLKEQKVNQPILVSRPFNFNHEKERLDSFVDWPVDFVSEIVLAKTGFFYLGSGDRVQCQFCKVILYDWSKGDNEVCEHIKWSPHCALLRRQPTQNVPIESIDYLLPPRFAQSVDECGCSKNIHLSMKGETKQK